MIRSMTGFARAAKEEDDFAVNIEMRSYNSRYLDISLRISPGYNQLEEKIKALLSERVTRGRLEIRVELRDASEEAYAFEINTSKARAYHEALVRLGDVCKLDSGLSLDHLLGAGGIIQPVEAERDMEAHWLMIRDCMNEAVEALLSMRCKEGDFIATDFAGRLDYIETSIARIEQESSGLLVRYQERLKDRIFALTKGMVEIDPNRIAQEAAFLADRSDISEEIVRAKSHLNQFRTIMRSEEPAGRKLNFLLQELNREFNTMGAKSEKADVSHMIVDVKSELEKVREQVQNVE